MKFITSNSSGTHNVPDNRIIPFPKYETPKCLHKQCSRCQGTGYDRFGHMCIHHLSCPCPRCTPHYYSTPIR